jgi:xanthine dehydrogenase accessory factor
MEHKFVEMAREKLRELSKISIVKKQVHNKATPNNQSGMICSGEQTILLFNLSKVHISTIGRIVESLSKNHVGVLKISPIIFNFIEDEVHLSFRNFLYESENSWTFEERLGIKNRLYIVGGGHCALAFSKIMQSLDFYITIFEDREHLNTLQSNASVHEKKIVKDYTELSSLVQEGKDVYVVIMTFGYRTDDIALRSIIHKNFHYLGVLGSKSKMEKMFAEWRKDNLPEEKLNKIFAPVGVPINSRTPAEIAISIAAQIIGIKNQ